jgi:hypothetical protein
MGKKSRRKKAYMIQPPVQNKAIIDAVKARDRQFFEGHPGETHYVRPYIPGEFPVALAARVGEALPSQDDWVLVTQLVPGSRTRQPLSLPDLQKWDGDHITIGLTSSQEIIRAYI